MSRLLRLERWQSGSYLGIVIEITALANPVTAVAT